MITEDMLLSDEEFDALSEEDQQRYLDLLADEAEAWTLTPRQLQAEEMCAEVDEFLYGGAAGGGKLQNLGAVVYTPFGETTIGALSVGDVISNPDGGTAKVVAVWEHGLQNLWRLTFSDGATTTAGADHLWNYRSSGKKIKRDIEWKVATTQQLEVLLLKAKAQEAAGRRPNWPLIPLTEPVEFTRPSSNRWGKFRPIDPYVLGVLLGDGSLTDSITVTSMDMEIAEAFVSEVERWGATWSMSQKKDNQACQIAASRCADFRAALEALGLIGHTAIDKFVPTAYKYAPVAERMAILQGLMDTDGHADSRGHASFVSISKQLALDVQWMAWSLGHKATITDKVGSYRDASGERVWCETAYTVTFSGRDATDLFRLERKRQRCGPVQQPGIRRLVSIEPAGEAICRCITVDNPNGLYLTDDFIVTHNSEWMLWHADNLSRSVPGHASLLLRQSFPELRRSLIRRSFTRLLYTDSRCERPVWRAADKEWRYPNGSVIELGYSDTDDSVGQYLSAEYDFIGFEELTEFSEYQYEMIRSRARTTRKKRLLGARPHVGSSTNPGRAGHGWVKKLYVVGTGYGDHIRTITTKMPTGDEAHRRIGFLPATVMDNPHIDPKYVEHLMSLPENLRRQYLEGDWDSFEGQYFPEFAKAKTLADGTNVAWHVVEPFEVPHEWPRFRAIDYGYAAPFACLWFTVDQDGHVFVYREAYQSGLTPLEQAALVNRLSVCTANGVTKPEKIDYTVADPSMWSHRGDMTLAAQYAKGGVRLRRGENDRLAGWARCRDWLRAAEAPEGVIPRPGIQFFSSCTNLIRTFPELIHDKNKPEDLDTTGDDHLADALRYGLMTRPPKFKPTVEPDTSLQARIWQTIDRMSNRRRIHPELGKL